MYKIQKKFTEKAAPLVEELQKIKKEHGDKVIGQYTIDQVISGQKGMVGLMTDTSKLDPEEGIRYRGYSIPELQEKLPRNKPDGEPLPEGLFHLLLLNEIPTKEDCHYMSMEWAARAVVPKHVFDVLDALPRLSRPMTQFSTAILAMATESKFQKAYRAGIHKRDYWETTLEDVMDLIARLPIIAAYIYRKNLQGLPFIEPDPTLDWAGNLAHMMGFESEEMKRLFRLYMVIHADHEGGNVSAHTTHLVGSALSNAYYSFAAGMLGLAGPLHGYANQEVIRWIQDMVKEIDMGPNPPREKIEAYIHQTLQEGKVVPGYGHAVLRKTDPRFTAQYEFAKKYVKNDPMIDIVNTLYEVVPPILGSVGKIKNPWPNVDAYSGALLMHFGLTDYRIYTVMFGVSRALGVLAQLVWDRMYGLPLERPSSHPLEWFKKKAEEQ
jgi:citrate synthase